MKKKIFLLFILFIYVGSVKADEIKLGTYKIVSASNENLFLVENNRNIELGNEQSDGTKLWDIYSCGNYYYIKNHDDNTRAIELAGAGRTNGTNIQTYTVNNTAAQKWKFVYTGSQSYYITNVLGNYNIDISYGQIKYGTNIQMYQNNSTAAQKWIFKKVDDEQQELPDGNYIIKGKNNINNVIDLKNASTANSTNIWMYTNNNSWAQIWQIRYNDGFYKISSIFNSSKVVDVYSGKFKNCSNIHLFQSNDTNAQKFKITKNTDGTYSIRSFDGLWALDIYSGYTKSGTNLHLFQPNDTNAQKFIFEKVNLSDIESGYYNIESILGDNLVVGVNNKALANAKNVDLREKTDFNYTKWYIKKIERDIYTISNADNKKLVLDVNGNAIANGTNVQLYTSNNTTAQKWIIRKNEDDTYKFLGLHSGRVLDVKGGSSIVGTNIQIYDSNGSNAQKFKITQTDVSEYTREYDDGQYSIKHSNGKMLDISGACKANDTRVVLFQSNETKAQIWQIKYNGDGEYIIRSVINPKLVLTAKDNNIVSSRNVNNDYQKWFFDKQGDETYILNKATGKYLSSSGSSIILSTVPGDKFSLVPYKKVIQYKGIDISEHNGNINFANVASSVDFVVIRAGFAEEKIVNGVDRYQDSKFIKNVEECEKYNIPYALYLYSYANYVTGNYDSASLEAEHMKNLIKKITSKGYYPTLQPTIYFDQEDSSISNLGSKTLTASINEFCRIMNNNGQTCGVYANQNWLDNRVDINNIVAKNHKVWVAQWPGYNTYAAALSSKSSYTKTPHNIWQFTSNGSISGISGRVDLDIGYDIFK